MIIVEKRANREHWTPPKNRLPRKKVVLQYSYKLHNFFLQVIHFPKNRFKALPPDKTARGAYPVCVMAGQFQEQFRRCVQ